MFVKAMIKKSYSHQIRPAVVLFQDRNLQSAYSICPIGTSGVVLPCFGFVAFLMHYCVTGEKFLELTCTQKWHRRTRKVSISMIPLKDIKVKSARMKRENKGIVISPADPSESYLKRDTSSTFNPGLISDSLHLLYCN